MREILVRIVQSMVGQLFDGGARRGADRARADTSLSCVWNIACNGLQAKAAGGLLTVEDLTVLALLLHFELLHLALLLPLHLVPLPRHRSNGSSLHVLDILLHALLVDLVIQDALVRILHFVLIHPLLLDLLSSLRASDFFLDLLCLLELLLFFLLFQREVGHMFRVNMSLLVQSCALGGQITLLVHVKRIVLELGHGGHVGARLARFQASLPARRGHILRVLGHHGCLAGFDARDLLRERRLRHA